MAQQGPAAQTEGSNIQHGPEINSGITRNVGTLPNQDRVPDDRQKKQQNHPAGRTVTKHLFPSKIQTD